MNSYDKKIKGEIIARKELQNKMSSKLAGLGEAAFCNSKWSVRDRNMMTCCTAAMNTCRAHVCMYIEHTSDDY